MKILTQIEGLIFQLNEPLPSQIMNYATEIALHKQTLLIPTRMVLDKGQINKTLIDQMEYFILEPVCGPDECTDFRDVEDLKEYAVMKISDKTLNYMLAVAK